MIINVNYDEDTSTLPIGFTSAVGSAVQFFESEIVDPITLNLHVGIGEGNGSPMNSGNLGQSYAF
jgi:hypothetical protein